MTEIIQLIQAIGFPAVAVLLIIQIVSSNSKKENVTGTTVAKIASDSTEEAFENADKLVDVYKQFGDLKQELGRAQGQSIVLMDNIKTSELKREAFELVMKDKIFALEQADKSKTVLIARHEGRIAELETESKRKDEIILSKEKEIVELTIERTQLQTTVANQAVQLAQQEKSIQLATRAYSLDDTLQLTEAEILDLADPVRDVELTEVPKPTTETNEPKDNAA